MKVDNVLKMKMNPAFDWKQKKRGEIANRKNLERSVAWRVVCETGYFDGNKKDA